MSSDIITPDFTTVGKILQFDGSLVTGEPRALLVDPYFGQNSLLKEAQVESEALKFAQTIKPRPGKTCVLLISMGAYEFYGDNRNGDGFPEKPVPGFVEPGQELPLHYHTFEQAHNFVHHVNRDPAKAVGIVIKAFYNWRMHRVELIIEVDNEKGHNIVNRIADGEYPPVSMGCRIKFDTCSICGNKAPSRNQYCWHLRRYMGRFLPNSNQKAFAYNPSPKFFDISWVIRPADRTGYMLKKIARERTYEFIPSAEAGELVALANDKAAELRKASDIVKLIKGHAVDAKSDGLSAQEIKGIREFMTRALPAYLSNTPDISDSALEFLAQRYTLPEIITTLSSAGIVLTTPEFAKLILHKTVGHVPEEAERLIDALVFNQDQIFDLMAENPKTVDAALGTGGLGLTEDKNNPKMAALIEPWIEKRSQALEYMKRRLVPLLPPPFRSASRPKLEALYVRDPATGELLRTTRGMAEHQTMRAGKTELMKGIGTAGVLGALYKLLQSSGTPGRILAPLTAVGGSLAAIRHYMNSPDPVKSLSGESLYKGTPLFKKHSALGGRLLFPLLTGAGLAALLAQDYKNRGWAVQQAKLMSGKTGQPDPFPWYETPRSSLGNVAYEHPVLTGGVGALAAHQALGGIGNIGRLALSLIKRGSWEESFDGINCSDVDFPRLVENLGRALQEVCPQK